MEAKQIGAVPFQGLINFAGPLSSSWALTPRGSVNNPTLAKNGSFIDDERGPRHLAAFLCLFNLTVSIPGAAASNLPSSRQP